jgi:hypothetical protein
MDGWAQMANTAHEATTFEELRVAGEAFGKVLGEDASEMLAPVPWAGANIHFST